MSLDTRIGEALDKAAEGARSRPDAWEDIQRRLKTSRRRRTVGSAVALALLVTAAAVGAPRLVRTVQPVQPPPTAPPTSIPREVARIPINNTIALASTPDGIYALSLGNEQTPRGILSKIDPARNRVVSQIRTGYTPLSVAFGDGSIWVAHGPACGYRPTEFCPEALRQLPFDDPMHKSVWRIDPKTMKVLAELRIVTSAVFFADGSPWAVGGGVYQIDTEPQRDIPKKASVAGSGTAHLAAGEGFIWVTTAGSEADPHALLSVIDPKKAELVEILDAPRSVSGPPVTVAFGSVWIAGDGESASSSGPGTSLLDRIDPKTRKSAARISLPNPQGDSPAAVTSGNGYVWVLGVRGNLWKIDPGTNSSPVSPVPFGGGAVVTRAMDVVTGFGSVWLTGPDGAVRRVSP